MHILVIDVNLNRKESILNRKKIERYSDKCHRVVKENE